MDELISVSTFNSIQISWKTHDASWCIHELRATLHPTPANHINSISVPVSVGKFAFHFLQPSSPYQLKLEIYNRNDGKLMDSTGTIRACTNPCPFNLQVTPFIVLPQHELGGWVMDCPGDWMWTICDNLNSQLARDFVLSLFRLGLFILPHRNNRIIPIINPVQRYCIDLNAPIKWAQSKQLRRHKGDFTLSISFDFGAALRQVARGQTELKGTTWLNPDLIDAFCAMKELHRDQPVTHHSFELWEGSELVAVTVGFGVGRAFHDYSMLALKRDHRSCGSILTKAVGHLLQLCGYTIWYWGIKNEYMHEYDSKGGRKFERAEFWARWSEATAQTPQKSILEELAHGNALISPRFSLLEGGVR
jgi:Leu/Phe-tRNA-protein transferase